MNLDKAIKKRHSVKRFKLKKPDYGKILEAIEAATKGPLAGNIPTLKFMLISDKEKIAQLAEASTQDFVGSTHYVVVVCSDPSNCVRSYEKRGEMYCLQQAGAAIQNFLLKITEMKLATCWVGAFSDKTVKRILKIPDNVRVDGLFPVGYELGKLEQKNKPSLDASVYFDTWKNKYMKPISKPEAK